MTLLETIGDLKALDRQDRIETLIALGEEFRNPSSEELPRTDSARVPGCESEAYVARTADGYRFAVDNPQGISAMALAVLLQDGLRGASAAEILALDDDLIYDVFGRELSMGKSLGLTNMVRVVKKMAHFG